MGDPSPYPTKMTWPGEAEVLLDDAGLRAAMARVLNDGRVKYPAHDEEYIALFEAASPDSSGETACITGRAHAHLVDLIPDEEKEYFLCCEMRAFLKDLVQARASGLPHG